MDDLRQTARPSGLPRPSRLPIVASTSPTLTPSNLTAGGPPSSAMGRTRALRAMPSRESLTGELRNPKLRAVPSRDRLASPSPAALASSSPTLSVPKSAPLRQPSQPLQPSPRTRAVSGQYVKAPRHSLGGAVAVAPSPLSPSSSRQPLEAPKRPLAGIPSLARRSSRQLLAGSPSPSSSPPILSPAGPASPTEDDGVAGVASCGLQTNQGTSFAAAPASLGTVRPGLSQRAVQTLSQVHSSPKGKSMAFFDATATSPAAVQEAPAAVPQALAGGKPKPKTVALRPSQSRSSLNGLYRKPSATNLGAAPSSAAPPAARKASLASHTSRTSRMSRASSTSYEETNASGASIASTALSVDSADSAMSSRKSSAALREQIAKAKAAKRAAAATTSTAALPRNALTTEPALDDGGISVDDAPASGMAAIASVMPLTASSSGLDFDLSADPFGQNRGGQAQTKVIQARVQAARTSGRLNIAAMGLREIPDDVMNIYDAEAPGANGGASWAESVDLTRFVAADNEIEMIQDAVFPDLSPEELAEQEDGRGNIFGGLETLDLHGNMLICLPMGLRRLQMLTSLNLSQNRVTNNALEVISRITSLRDLKVGGNLFYGPLDPCFASLENLEIADLHGNNISALPLNIGNMTKLRILNISENNFESLVFEPLSKLPLTELSARKNKLSGVLIEDVVTRMPSLQVLDLTANQIAHLVSPSRTSSPSLELPALRQLSVSMNRLQALPDIGAWQSLHTIAAEENSISVIPDGFTRLAGLRHVDFSSNDIRVIPPEIGRMENLAMFRLSGNPLRDKKFCTATTDEIKATLVSRLEPEPEPEPEPLPALEPEPEAPLWTRTNTEGDSGPKTSISLDSHDDELRDAVTELSSKTQPQHGRHKSSLSLSNVVVRAALDDAGASDARSDDDFATPPTSAHHTPARSRSHTVSSLQQQQQQQPQQQQVQPWTIRPGGVLDRSETESSSLHPVIAARVAKENRIYEIYLQRNLFTAMPDALSFFADTLTVLSLSRNALTGESYLGDAAVSDGLALPALRELNLSSNHITGLGPLVQHLRAPSLQKLDVSLNRVAALPPARQPLRAAFPELTVLLAANNHMSDLDPEAIRGLRVVDVTNNDIEHLNPRLGLLSASLERLDVLGNRFRVPRFNVLERGTEATLRWLRGRVPVAEMAAWREANNISGSEFVDDDVD